jgi:hypothetical protein
VVQAGAFDVQPQHAAGPVVHLQDDLTENQLASHIREAYGVSDDEEARELTNWQQRPREIDRDA